MGHTGAYIINSFFTGSSPPMLGIPLSAPGGDLSKWFIPTYVGHTWADLLKFMSRTVHPHIRGAYRVSSCILSAASGSSPHTWGILNPADYADMTVRFIPTYVGHILSTSMITRAESVHPHLRGAYGYSNRVWKCPFGSSPPTWGILQRQRVGHT